MNKLNRMLNEKVSNTKICRVFITSSIAEEDLLSKTGRQLFDAYNNLFNAFISIIITLDLNFYFFLTF